MPGADLLLTEVPASVTCGLAGLGSHKRAAVIMGKAARLGIRANLGSPLRVWVFVWCVRLNSGLDER